MHFPVIAIILMVNPLQSRLKMMPLYLSIFDKEANLHFQITLSYLTFLHVIINSIL